MRLARAWVGLIPLVCIASAAASAEFYRWVDPAGRVHITDDLSQVPAAQRAAARRASQERPEPAPTGWNQIAVDSPAYAARERSTAPSARPGQVHRIRVEQAGTSLTVAAMLDGRQQAVFKVDTGAEMNMVPQHVVDAMGIVIDGSTPSMMVVGISGNPMRLPIVHFREVRLGTARVRDVDMTVNPNGTYGLLGMTFFNHFKVQTDPVAGVLTLEEVDEEAATAAGVYGGFGESYWRREFGLLHRQLEELEVARKQAPSTHVTLQDRIDEQERALRKRLDDLHERASRAGVPRSWRE
ncbi:MAG: retroviral-like aspartic protease family protein [Myxococcota bacterium]